MTYYKVISKENKAKNGGNFDYTKYLPKDDNSQEWLPEIKDIVECSKGYHVTKYWNIWIDSKDDKIFEVEIKGLLEKKEIVGVIEKRVCSSIRFIREVTFNFDEKMNTGNCNTGNKNTGKWNTGDSNTGISNTGYCNTGNCNTGNSNTGKRNTGYNNTGDWNTGCSNTGDCNTGDWNTGKRNTGECNTGDRNTGNCNTGNKNTGNFNIGKCNTGNWNISDFNNGFFNTKELKTIKVFNKECSKKLWDNCIKPKFIYFDLTEGDYKECFKKSFNNTTKEDVELLISLPNFDYEVFAKISGITKQMITKKLKSVLKQEKKNERRN